MYIPMKKPATRSLNGTDHVVKFSRQQQVVTLILVVQVAQVDGSVEASFVNIKTRERCVFHVRRK